jgi:hypothetical protein
VSKLDFPVTRQLMERLDGGIEAIGAPIVPLRRVPAPPPHPGFLWEAGERTIRVVLLGKAVRVASGVRAAMALADLGFVTECGAILRIVYDFTLEINAVCEGFRSGTPSAAQKKFVEQYFTPMPATPEEYASQEHERFVRREDLLKSHTRLAMEMGEDVDVVRRQFAFMAFGLDKFVHGSWMTAVELYRGDTHTFMLNGHVDSASREGYKRFVASKLHETLAALAFVATVMGMPALHEDIKTAAKELFNSGELFGGPEPI